MAYCVDNKASRLRHMYSNPDSLNSVMEQGEIAFSS